MKVTTALTALAATFATANGHLCTLSPLQRGGAEGAEYAGNNTCLHTTGPCDPAVPAGPPTAYYVQGERLYAHAMKNLDHFYATAPGNFSAYLWDAQGKSMFLAATPDTAAPDFAIYELAGNLPKNLPAGSYVLQTIYQPNNPGAPPSFYQCSDIQVLAPAPPTEEQLAAAHEHCKEHM